MSEFESSNDQLFFPSLKRRIFQRQSCIIKPHTKFAFAGESTNDENKLYERYQKQQQQQTKQNNSKLPRRQAIDSITLYWYNTHWFIIISTRSKYTYCRVDHWSTHNLPSRRQEKRLTWGQKKKVIRTNGRHLFSSIH